jgi:hypothetical protein
MYENGVIIRPPNVDASIKPVPSPLTDWGKITITYTDVKLKEAVEQLFTKYPNSIQLPFEPTTTAVVAAVAPVVAPVAAPVVAAVAPAVSPPARPRTKRIKKRKIVTPPVTPPPTAQPPPPPPATNPLKPTVRTTTEGVSAPYKSKSGMWCEVIIGNGKVGKPGDHLEVCSSQEGLTKLINKYQQTDQSIDPYINDGGLEIEKPEVPEDEKDF